MPVQKPTLWSATSVNVWDNMWRSESEVGEDFLWANKRYIILHLLDTIVSCCLVCGYSNSVMCLCDVGTAPCTIAWTVRKTSWPIPAAARTARNATRQSHPGHCWICDGENRKALCRTASVRPVTFLQWQQLSVTVDLCLVAWSWSSHRTSQVCWWPGILALLFQFI